MLLFPSAFVCVRLRLIDIFFVSFACPVECLPRGMLSIFHWGIILFHWGALRGYAFCFLCVLCVSVVKFLFLLTASCLLLAGNDLRLLPFLSRFSRLGPFSPATARAIFFPQLAFNYPI